MSDFVKILDNHLQVIYENKELKKGVSGLMRVRDDAEFVGASIDSCIDALDELIIVYNDCTDDTPNIVREKAKQYPEKIRVYEYPYKVYAINLTKEEYDYITNESLDSPHRLCNYYNFALSKVKYEYAMKIDADQIYFTEKLKYWCDTYRQKVSFSLKAMLGAPIAAWIVYNIKKGNDVNSYYLRLLKANIFREAYYQFVRYYISRNNKNNISLSGLNIYRDTNKWFTPLGFGEKGFRLLPPFNGVGDHLIFKVNEYSYYYPADKALNDSYTKQRSDCYTSIEVFNKSFHSLFVGTTWFHMNCMRKNLQVKMSALFSEHPNRFMDIYSFQNSKNYKKISKKIDSRSIPNTALFEFLYVYRDVDYEKMISKLVNKI